MPIEKILTRTFAGLSLVFLILTLTYYPPSYAIFPAMFLMVFVISDILLPNKSERVERRWEKVASKIIIGLLIIGVLGCLASVLTLWKMGPFDKFINQ